MIKNRLLGPGVLTIVVNNFAEAGLGVHAIVSVNNGVKIVENNYKYCRVYFQTSAALRRTHRTIWTIWHLDSVDDSPGPNSHLHRTVAL